VLVRARRLRRRYLVFKVKTREKDRIWSRREVEEALISSILVLHGVMGLVRSHFKLAKYDEQRGIGILSCSHRYVDLVRSAILIAGLRLGDSTIHTIKVTGTLKKAIRIFNSLPKNTS